MKFQVQLVLLTHICLGISFAFKLSFFFGSSHPGVLFWKVVLWRCAVNLRGMRPCQDAISTKSQSSFDEIALWHGCSPVSLLCIFGAHFGGLLLRAFFSFLFVFFCFGVNLRGEIGIQLDVSLWSHER